jgi:uncharacterized membrane protein
VKKLYGFLKIALWSFVGVFIGRCIVQYRHYKKYPALYAMANVPWYHRVALSAVFTLVIVAVLLVLLLLIKRKIGQDKP